MEIRRILRIDELKSSRFCPQVVQLIFWRYQTNEGDYSWAVIDDDDCNQFGITKSLALIGQSIICTFTSRELPRLQAGPFCGKVDISGCNDEDLMIHTLRRCEDHRFSISKSNKPAGCETSQCIELRSFIDVDEDNNPSYKFIIDLSAEEYALCTELPSTSVFRVSFRLA